MSEQNLNALKTLVISMGIVLIVGFLFVGAAVWMKMKAPPAGAASVGDLPANCPGGTLDLKGRGQVVDTSVEGRLLRMAVARSDGGLEMIHIDICTGKELSTLNIMTDPQ